MRTARRLAVGALAAAACALAACAPDRSGSELPTAADMLRLLSEGGGRNVAVTTPDADDPRLRPHTYVGKASEVARAIEQAITPLPRWKVIGGRNGVIWLTHRTRLGFVDDIHLLLIPTGDSTAVFARSASRIGYGDFGQNRRNLAELWAALDAAIEAKRKPTALTPRPALRRGAAVFARTSEHPIVGEALMPRSEAQVAGPRTVCIRSARARAPAPCSA